MTPKVSKFKEGDVVTVKRIGYKGEHKVTRVDVTAPKIELMVTPLEDGGNTRCSYVLEEDCDLVRSQTVSHIKATDRCSRCGSTPEVRLLSNNALMCRRCYVFSVTTSEVNS